LPPTSSLKPTTEIAHFHGDRLRCRCQHPFIHPLDSRRRPVARPVLAPERLLFPIAIRNTDCDITIARVNGPSPLPVRRHSGRDRLGSCLRCRRGRSDSLGPRAPTGQRQPAVKAWPRGVSHAWIRLRAWSLKSRIAQMFASRTAAPG
jgi:hypothetical protein